MRKIIWTFENCKKEALKYKLKSEFRKNSVSAYSQSVRNKWIDLICIHMKPAIKKKGYWTFENCKEEALKYKTRSEFSKSKGWAYQTSLNNEWLDVICKHMKVVGNIKKRCIYAYEFTENYVYVGLTFDFEKRWTRRIKDEKDIVNIFMKETGKIPKKIQLTNYVDIDIAVKLEKKYVNEYDEKKWIILNRIKTGSLGGNIIKWTFENCKKEALKYKTHTDFKNKNNNCLAAIYKNNWHSELLFHLKYFKKPNNFWCFENCLEKALSCNSKLEFNKKFVGAYASSKKNGWFEQITSHMK